MDQPQNDKNAKFRTHKKIGGETISSPIGL